MKFSDLLGHASEDAGIAAPESPPPAPLPVPDPVPDATTDATPDPASQEPGATEAREAPESLPVLGRPPGIPPLVEEVSVRFSPVPMPPVPPYDDVVPEPPAAASDGITDAPGAELRTPPSEEVPVRFTRVEIPPARPAPEPAPEPAPLAELAPEALPLPVPEPAAELVAEPPPPEPDPVPAATIEPLPEPAPEPVPDVAAGAAFAPLDEVPEYRRSLEPAPISVLAAADPSPPPESTPLGPAPTAASVFGGQRGAELAGPVATPESPEVGEPQPPVLRFDLVDDDLLPVGRRRARR